MEEKGEWEERVRRKGSDGRELEVVVVAVHCISCRQGADAAEANRVSTERWWRMTGKNSRHVMNRNPC